MNCERCVKKVSVNRGQKKKMHWKQKKKLSQIQEKKEESSIIVVCDSDDEEEFLSPLIEVKGDEKKIGNEKSKQENDNMDIRNDESSPSPQSEVLFNGDLNDNPFDYLTPEKKHSLKKININESDLQKLNDGECVNDVIINFYVNHLKNNVIVDENVRSRFSFFNTFFFSKLVQIDKEINKIITSHYKESFEERLKLCLRWTKDENIFQKDYIFFPVFDDAHWSLCVLCYPREIGMSNSRSTLLHFDSFTPSHESTMVFRSMRRFLNVELKEAQKNDSENNSNIPKVKKIFAKHIPGHRVEVPQQDNLVDCGCFLLYFIQRFITNIPTNLDIKYLNEEMFGENCFHPSKPSELRLVIKKLMLSKIGVIFPLEENVKSTATKRELSMAFEDCHSIDSLSKRVKVDSNSSMKYSTSVSPSENKGEDKEGEDKGEDKKGEDKEGEDKEGEGVGIKKIEMKSSQTICLMNENFIVYKRMKKKKNELSISNSSSQQTLFQNDNIQSVMKMVESSNALATKSSFAKEKDTTFMNGFERNNYNNNNYIDIIEHSLNTKRYDMELDDEDDSKYNIHSFDAIDAIDVSNGFDDEKSFFTIPHLLDIDQSSMANSSSLPLPITSLKKGIKDDDFRKRKAEEVEEETKKKRRWI